MPFTEPTLVIWNIGTRRYLGTLRLQFWYKLLLHCWEPAFHVQWDAPQQYKEQGITKSAHEAVSEVLPALQEGICLQFG